MIHPTINNPPPSVPSFLNIEHIKLQNFSSTLQHWAPGEFLQRTSNKIAQAQIEVRVLVYISVARTRPDMEPNCALDWSHLRHSRLTVAKSIKILEFLQSRRTVADTEKRSIVLFALRLAWGSKNSRILVQLWKIWRLYPSATLEPSYIDILSAWTP